MSEFSETAEGTLVVMVCRARHLPNRRKLDKQSPYVLLRVNAVAKKTPAHFRAGQTPEWTHEIRFQLTRDRKPVMRLDVLDETKSDPTPIGGTDIDCSTVFSNPENLQETGKYILDGWYELSCKERYAGKIFLEMTFYPSAPMLPPKLSSSGSAYHYSSEPQMDLEHEDSFRHSAPAAPVAPVAHVVPTHMNDDIFVSSPPQKTSFFRSSNPDPHTAEEDVFVEVSKPKTGRFSKLKDKFLAKEPITGLWAHDHKPSTHDFGQKLFRLPGHSHVRTPSPLEDLDDLSVDIGLPHIPPENFLPNDIHTSHRQLPPAPPDPPSPPPHSTSGSLPVETQRHMLYDNRFSGMSPNKSPNRSPNRSPFKMQSKSPEMVTPMASSTSSSPSRNRRKPPPDMVEKNSLPSLDTTNIPFSADNFQLDSTPSDYLPTKVYHMDKPVKSLTVMATDREKHALNPNEIDPRFYAPTPSEHLSKSTLLKSKSIRFEENEMQSSGYLGEGTWNIPKAEREKFSPSVFQRINNENEGEENKPAVPPKIPQGLSEKEYYVLDKDNYLKDINGRRF